MSYKDNHMNDMPYLSKKGLQMERELKILADKYEYKKLPEEISRIQRAHYMEELDDFWKNSIFKTKEIHLTTRDGAVIATGVTDRGYVCGDYGVFLEIDPEQINRDNIKVQPGEEYRIADPKYANHVKYHWYTDNSGNHIKLYYQQKGVTYADYLPGKWYVSPYEVQVEIIREKEISLPTLEEKDIVLIEHMIQLERQRILSELTNQSIKMSEAKGNSWDPSSHKYYKAVSLKAATEIIQKPIDIEQLFEEAQMHYEQTELNFEELERE